MNSSPPSRARNAPSRGSLHAARRPRAARVAGGMAEHVVDLLEAVEIDAQHREASSGAAGALERRGEALVERRAVRQVGQRIVMREMRDARLVALALGHVLDDRLIRYSGLPFLSYIDTRWR